MLQASGVHSIHHDGQCAAGPGPVTGANFLRFVISCLEVMFCFAKMLVPLVEHPQCARETSEFLFPSYKASA